MRNLWDFSKIHFEEYHWYFLHWFEYELGNSIESIDQFLKLSEEQVKLREENFKKEIENDPYFKSEDDPEVASQYYSQMYEHIEIALNELRIFQRNSTLISLYAFFEGRFKQICELIQYEINPKIRIEDLSGRSDIGRYRKFLTKVFELKLENSEKYLTRIEQQKLVRNAIVHNNGEISSSELQKFKLPNGLMTKSYSDGREVFIINSEAFIQNLIRDVDNFFKELIIEINKKAANK